MIVLAAATSLLRMTTSTAEPVDAVVRYQRAAGAGWDEGSNQVSVSAATTTTLLEGDPQEASQPRVVRNIAIRNRGSSAQTVTLLATVGGTDYTLTPAVSLTAGWTLIVDAEGRLHTYDVNGVLQIKVGSGGGGSSPTTTAGDMIYHDGAADAALAIGSAGQVLTVSGGFPAWVAPDATLSYARAVGVAHLS